MEILVQSVSMENLVSSPFLLRLSIPFHPWLKSPHCQGTRFTRVLASQPVGDAQRRVWGARAERLFQTYRGWASEILHQLIGGSPIPLFWMVFNHPFGSFSWCRISQPTAQWCSMPSCWTLLWFQHSLVVPIFTDELLPCSYCAKMMFNEFNESTWWINLNNLN